MSQSAQISIPVTSTRSAHKTFTTRTQRPNPVGEQLNAPHPRILLLKKNTALQSALSNLHHPIPRMNAQLERAVMYKYHIIATPARPRSSPTSIIVQITLPSWSTRTCHSSFARIPLPTSPGNQPQSIVQDKRPNITSQKAPFCSRTVHGKKLGMPLV